MDGYRLWVGRRRADGSLETPAPFKMKGVGWSPTAVGQSNDGGYRELYTQHAGSDAPLMSELASRWIEDGSADRFAEAQRRECRIRHAMAQDILRD